MSHSGPPLLRLTAWGTRGSIPSPGPSTVRYGGNTSCVQVHAGGAGTYLFDAGTGIRAVSRRLAEGHEPVAAELFVTHYHWDHIQGFPFCAPLYEADARLRVHGPPGDGATVAEVFARQMSPVFFPVPLDAVAARVEWAEVNGAVWTDGQVEVAAYRTRHPGYACGYRVRAGSAAAVYIPDNEIGTEPDEQTAWYAGLVEFARGADVLIHDAMLDEPEYERFRGWGHSTYRQAVRLAEDAGVARLLLFHHAPDRTDVELDRVVEQISAELDARGSTLSVEAAREGSEIVIPALSR
jgi:phosphoribosyl 1,2-cyclic phosphodiesterase